MSAKKRFLNLGCGRIFNPDWINVDFESSGPDVLPYDLRLGLPFPDESMELVYHSHVLEHFSKRRGEFLLRECLRVLRPGGLLRLAVPDLENITRAYLKALDEVREAGASGPSQTSSASSAEAQARHQWMLIELVDQLTRERSGGETLPLWTRDPLPAEDFIIERTGQEYIFFRKGLSPAQLNAPQPPLGLPDFKSGFRHGGEPHRWMYDEVSLRALLLELGFTGVTKQSFDSSLEPEAGTGRLDADFLSGRPDRARKPDSLFMEARKPAAPAFLGIKSALFSSTDRGGAGIAALRQHEAVRQSGIASHLYVAAQSGLAPGVHVFPTPSRPAAPEPGGSYALPDFMDAHNATPARLAEIYPNRPHGAEFYSILDGTCDFAALPCAEDFDLFHLHWVSNFMQLESLPKLLAGRPLVWTLHDLRPFTGGCHYAGECKGYLEKCGSCPQLGSHSQQDPSRLNWLRQKEIYSQINLHVVAPSQWLAAEAAKSGLFKNVPVHHIANPHPLDVFRPLEKAALRQRAGLTPDNLVLLFSSVFLGNTRKGINYLLECMGVLAQSHLADKLRILMLGADPHPAFFETGLSVIPVGAIADAQEMAQIYNLADGVLAPSLEDNQPSVICEALACGVPVAAFNSGGIAEMIIHGHTGWLAPAKDAMSLAEGVVWLDASRKNPAISRQCRAFALEHWHHGKQGKAYAELYRQAAGKR